MAKSLNSIISELIGFITTAIPGISTRSGTVVRDVVVNAPAQEFSLAYTELDTVAQLSSLQNYNSFTIAQMDAVATDYGLTRLLGTNSLGTCIFRFKVLTDVSIPFGTQLSTTATSGSVVVNFIVSSAIFISQSDLPGYYNYSTGYYEVSASIESINVGSVNNVDASTITNIASSISNLDSVINNLPTTSGTDDESNQSLAARINVKRMGNNIGTKSGYENTINADNRVIDSIVVSPNDPEMQRNEFGGSIDIYILGTSLTSIDEAQVWSLGMTELVLEHQPVHTVGTVVGSSAGTLVSTTDYVFTKDVGLLAKSSESTDKIVFTATGLSKLAANNGQTITITYSYNKLIEDLQSAVDADTQHIITADILMREALEILVNVHMEVTVLSGYNKTTVQSDIQTNIGNYINAFFLNTDLYPSDLVGIAENTTGVDKVDIATLTPATDTIADRTSYLRAGTLTIVML
jgi:uncharacterized phage protein gp47/JayE